MINPPLNILKDINSPDDLKKLDLKELTQLCSELRQFIIEEVSNNPGHFGASLGVVELTVALHYVFDTPLDKLVWDVGHQAYAHKILTGRKDVFRTNRLYNGISGFPKMDESKYDAIGGGHSSVSISQALGMAIASQQKGSKQKAVAIIGDGSLTGGVAFEGLNNAGMQNADILVILNDNNMAIDPNVGALKNYMLDITTSKTYNRLKEDVWNTLGFFSSIGRFLQRFGHKTSRIFKAMFLKQSNLFESLNFRYFGPIDGHDLPHLIQVLEDLKKIPGPKVLHCITVKGKGYKYAEENQTLWHAPGLFNKDTGEIFHKKNEVLQPLNYHEVFGKTLLELAQLNSKIVAVTPAMPSGCGMSIMRNEMPNRVFDVGIAEQHALSFSAGIATEGLIPFCNVYSSFLQRAYDQIIHDIAIQNLPVVLCVDRAGLVGSDGATHHGLYDIAFMRCIPNMVIASPMNEIELRNLMFTAQADPKHSFAIRYPRGKGVVVDWQQPFQKIEIGKGQLIKKGRDIAVISLGPIGNLALRAIQQFDDNELSVALYDLRFVKPLDEPMLHEIFTAFKHVITIEDGALNGGMGSAILEFMNEHNYSAQVKRLGVADVFVQHGAVEELQRECGIDVAGIETAIKEVSLLIPSRVNSIAV